MILREDDKGTQIPGLDWLRLHMHWFWTRPGWFLSFHLQTLNRKPLSLSQSFEYICFRVAICLPQGRLLLQISWSVGFCVAHRLLLYSPLIKDARIHLISPHNQDSTWPLFHIAMHLNTVTMRKMVSKKCQVRLLYMRNREVGAVQTKLSYEEILGNQWAPTSVLELWRASIYDWAICLLGTEKQGSRHHLLSQVLASNPSIWKVKAGRLGVQGHSQLCSVGGQTGLREKVGWGLASPNKL